MKYVLFIIIAIVLWITTPFWMVDHTKNSAKTNIDDYIIEKKEEASELSAKESEKLRKFVEKFGEKPKVRHSTGTPILVQNYWKKNFKHPEAVVELKCTPLRESDKGG